MTAEIIYRVKKKTYVGEGVGSERAAAKKDTAKRWTSFVGAIGKKIVPTTKCVPGGGGGRLPQETTRKKGGVFVPRPQTSSGPKKRKLASQMEKRKEGPFFRGIFPERAASSESQKKGRRICGTNTTMGLALPPQGGVQESGAGKLPDMTAGGTRKKVLGEW